MSYQQDLDDAERAIGRILKELEAKHPSYCVTDIGFETIEMTNMMDTRKRMQRHVVIELQPNATNEWLT